MTTNRTYFILDQFDIRHAKKKQITKESHSEAATTLFYNAKKSERKNSWNQIKRTNFSLATHKMQNFYVNFLTEYFRNVLLYCKSTLLTFHARTFAFLVRNKKKKRFLFICFLSNKHKSPILLMQKFKNRSNYLNFSIERFTRESQLPTPY